MLPIVECLGAIITVLIVNIKGEQNVLSQPEVYMVRPEGYKAQEIPISPKGSPSFTIIVDLQIWSITEISLENQHMGVDLILTVQWTDKRLTVNPNISSSRDWLAIGKEIDSLWSPTLTFLNCKGCATITFKSNSNIPVYIHKRKKFFWTQIRTLHTFGCSIMLQFYPMDVQQCHIQIYIGDDYVDAVTLKHRSEGKRNITSNITLSEFSLPKVHTGECSYRMEDPRGFSCLELRVRFERLIGYHMTTSYLPTIFIVVLSWISFWLPTDAIPARVALGLTSLLTLATRLDQAQRNLPAVSYSKAIDVWMLACIFLVSLSLLEFAVCNYMHRKGISCCGSKRHHPLPKIHDLSTQNPRFLSLKNSNGTDNQDKGALCDRISRVLFPLSFIIFNLAYWNYYLHSSPT